MRGGSLLPQAVQLDLQNIRDYVGRTHAGSNNDLASMTDFRPPWPTVFFRYESHHQKYAALVHGFGPGENELACNFIALRKLANRHDPEVWVFNYLLPPLKEVEQSPAPWEVLDSEIMRRCAERGMYTGLQRLLSVYGGGIDLFHTFGFLIAEIYVN
jgi:hypothetical protein